MKRILITNKRIIAIILLLITIFGTLQPVLAVSGSGTFVGGQFGSNVFTTDNASSTYGILIRKLINQTNGKQYTVFCAEHGVDFVTGSTYNGSYYTPTNATIKKACKIAYFGWYSKHGDYVVDGGILAESMNGVKMDYVFTQQYIWETLGQSSARFVNSSIQSQYTSFKAQINQQISDMEKRPSFDGTTIEIEAGETKTITDTNGVLSGYNSIDRTTNEVRFQHTKGENTLTITVSENCDTESLTITDATMLSWGMVKDASRNHDTTIYFTFPSGAQAQLYAANYNDPVTLSMALKINLFGKLELSKLDTNNTLIDGSVFNITGPNGYNKDVTVSNGKIVVEKLRKGTYYIREKSAPNGYLLNTETYQVEIKAAQTTKQAVTNSEPTGKILIHKVSENNDKLGGAVFKITAAEKITNKSGSKTFYTEGQEVAQITTASGTGIAQKDNLPLGKYYVKEIQAPQGYLLNEKTYTANLVYKDQNTPVIELQIEGVVDEEPRGSITIIKRDSETGATPQGDAKLENAIYKVYAAEDIYNVAKSKKFYNKGDLVATRTTNAKGETEDVTNLPLGKYVIREEKEPIGYFIDTKEYEVNLTYKDQHTKVITGAATSNEIVKKMGVHIYKSGINVNGGQVPGLEGAEFTIKLNSAVQRALDAGYTYAEIWNGIDEDGNRVTVDAKRVAEAQKIAPTYESIVTDENGNAYTVNKLPYGKYLVKETNTPKDYYPAADFTFSITQDESEIADVAQKVKHLVVNNEQMEAYIKLIKKDKTSGKNVTLTNATFQIKASKDIYDRGNGKILYKKGEVIKQKIGSTVYDSFTTNADNVVVPDGSYTNNKEDKSTVITPLLLPVGEYEVTEIKIPTGFLQLESPVKFTISNIRDYDKDNGGDYIKEVVITNEQPTGTIVIDKSIALREDADTSLIDPSDLSGIEFTLVAKEDVIDMADGSVIYKKGQEIGKYNLDKNGDLSITKLPMGKYEIYESKTLDGLVLNNTRYEIIFEKKDDTTKVYTEKRDITNETTFVEFSKVDITGEKELEGAKLTVLDKVGNVIDSWTSSEKTHKIEGLKVGTTYILREETAPDGFVKAVDVEFTVENTAEIQKVQMIDKVVEMTKTDIGGEEVEGAKMTVTDENGEIVDSWTSTKEPHHIKGLEEGKTYTLHEETAPDGFVKATDIEFTVTLDKETQKVEMIDKVVEMTKTDIGGEEVEGAEMTVTDENGEIVDSWTSTKEPHRINGLEEGKTYTLHEETAPDGFVKATDVEFTVTLDKETQQVEMIDKVVEMTKTDIGGEEVEGAKMTVTDENGDVVDEWTSAKEPHHINGLEEGKTYTLHEETAPDGFVKATDVEFTVTLDKETQKVEMIDKIVEMTKTDIGGEEVEGAEMTVTDENGEIVDSWTSTKEPHHIIGLEEGKTYTLHEETAPNGFVKATDVEFTVSLDKETQKLVLIDKILDVTKTDLVNGEEVEGAELVVTDKDGNIVDEWTSTKEPHHVTGLEEGETYTLTEKTAPYGYEVAESIEFTVSTDKETQIVEMKDMPILKSVQVEKVDKSTGEHIKSNKFEFGIYSDENCTQLIKKAGANEFEGTALFDDLRYGTYYIKEIKAPLGYKLSDQIVKIDINDEGVFADEVSLEEKDSVYSFVYYNSPLPAIQTGNEMNYTLLLSLLGISLLGITSGVIVIRRRNKKND